MKNFNNIRLPKGPIKFPSTKAIKAYWFGLSAIWGEDKLEEDEE
jgi:hypothetical protein